MVSVHIEVIIVNEEALSYSSISIIECMNVEPMRQKSYQVSNHPILSCVLYLLELVLKDRAVP